MFLNLTLHWYLVYPQPVKLITQTNRNLTKLKSEKYIT